MKKIKTEIKTLDDIDIPPIVYKYRDWDNEYHRRFILNREVYLAPPSSFEDEKDCKIPISFELLDNYEMYWYFLHQSLKIDPNILPVEKHFRLAEKKLKEKKLYIENFNKNYLKSLDQRLGVLSLTENPCNDKMWKDYANKHKGFCIGYDSRELFEFLGGGSRVNYHNKLPEIYPDPFMDDLERFYLIVYSKEKKWEYEEEYRTHKFWPYNIVNDSDRQIILPKKAFKKIIIGKKMSKKNKISLIKEIKKNIGNIDIIEEKNYC